MMRHMVKMLVPTEPFWLKAGIGIVLLSVITHDRAMWTTWQAALIALTAWYAFYLFVLVMAYFIARERMKVQARRKNFS